MKTSYIIGITAVSLIIIIAGGITTQIQNPPLDTKAITVIDYEGRTVTLDYPAERVVALVPSVLRIITQIDGAEKVVGIDDKAITAYPPILPILAYPEYLELPNVGERKEPNIEVILSLKPDVVFTTQSQDNADTLQEQLGVPVICVVSLPEADYEFFRLVGKIIGKEQEAEDVINYIQENTRRITSVTETIPDEDKPRIYLGLWTNEKVITNTMPSYQGIEPAGAVNLAADVAPTTYWGMAEIKKEQIIAWNPDIILIHWLSEPNYMTIQDVYNDPDLTNLNAVKNGRIYYSQTSNEGKDYASTLAELYYFAKIFHPDKFQDMDLNAECDAFFHRLYGLDNYYTEWTTEYGIIIG
jgi:iron complex transport system substrate-binding protein